MEGKGSTMSTWKRITDVFKAKTNKVLDNVEDPREALDLAYQEQLDHVTKVRRAVADVATSRKRVELQIAQIDAQAAKLQDQAKAALGQQNEDLAREALRRRELVVAQRADLDSQRAQLVEQEEKLEATAATLTAQVEAFRTKKETLKATYTAAKASSEISESLTGISTSMADAGATMQRAQDKVADMQARSGALDELLASGKLTDLTATHDDIQAQLDAAAATSSVDAQLAALKADIAGETK
jgi:phage shock protein A